jgi:hypothetical protein
LALWCVRAVSTGQVLDEWVARLVEPVWTLDPTVLVLSVAAIAVTIFLAPIRTLR